MLNKKALAASVSAPPAVFIDELFSTYLYTGNSSTQTITNGIDLAGEGGMVWLKDRKNTAGGMYHEIVDTVRGTGTCLFTNTSDGGAGYSDITSFNSNGFGVRYYSGCVNTNTYPQVSWTFRKQPKFFDVVTWTGNGVAGRTVAHNLGSTPGMIIIKSTTLAENWIVHHRSMGFDGYMALNATNGKITGDRVTAASSSTFTLGSNGEVNGNTHSYVAYLFAHDAGGFGESGTDNVISCGSYTGNGSSTGPVIDLGYEPQYILIKNATSTSDWNVIDNMRGIATGGLDYFLAANSTAIENSNTIVSLQATGFSITATISAVNSSGNTYIYMAIRRPMKVPTSGTEVFSPIASSAALNTKLTTGFPVDLQMVCARGGGARNATTMDRLRGVSTNATENDNYLVTSSTAAEVTTRDFDNLFWDNTGFRMPSEFEGEPIIFWNFRRAPGFMDVVCYSGSSTARTIPHNLGVAPELYIIKNRSASTSWFASGSGFPDPTSSYLIPNSTAAFQNVANFWQTPTATTIGIGTGLADNSIVNASGNNYVAYLFASCPGVSKVGFYTGTGTTQTINCGFTGGARFVMVKATSTTGDWIIVDTARGLVSGNDPTLALNSTAAEVTTNDWFDPVSSGFELSNAGGNLANSNGVSYIFLAVS